MGKLGKYSSYKDSDVEWLGEIPYNWEIKELKYALKFTTGGTPSSGVENYYNGEEPWVTIADMTGRYIEKSHFISKKAVRECNMQIVPKNSLLYSFKLSVGQVAFTKEEIYTNEAIASFYPSKNIDLNFWYYVLPIFLIKNANTNIYGAFLLNQDLIKNALIIFPPKDEQTKIASFLDEKTAQIDEVISQKEKLIELLKERKQIVINDAVIKGLDKNVEMIDSGVEWIGKIPKHWEVVRSKRLFQQRKDRARKGDKQLTASQKYGVIYQDKYMELEGRRVTQVEYNHEILKRAETGDFLISMRSFQGGIEYCRDTGSVSSAYVALIPIKHVVPEYFKYLFKSQKYITALSSTSNLVRDGQALRFENFSMVDLLIIPNKEQVEIAKYIDEQIEKIDTSIELQQNYISKLKEYKASLIDSVVTGKVKVS